MKYYFLFLILLVTGCSSTQQPSPDLPIEIALCDQHIDKIQDLIKKLDDKFWTNTLKSDPNYITARDKLQEQLHQAIELKQKMIVSYCDPKWKILREMKTENANDWNYVTTHNATIHVEGFEKVREEYLRLLKRREDIVAKMFEDLQSSN